MAINIRAVVDIFKLRAWIKDKLDASKPRCDYCGKVATTKQPLRVVNNYLRLCRHCAENRVEYKD